MESLKVFEIRGAQVEAGAQIDALALKGAGITIPAIIIGEEGRGRSRGVVPVVNPPQIPCPDRDKEVWASSKPECSRCGAELGELKDSRRPHPDIGQVQGRLLIAEVGQTKAGKPKLISRDEATTDEYIIVVFRTGMGFRGSNDHTGDRAGWKCSKYGCDASGEGVISPKACPKCGADGYDGPRVLFAQFPGQIIARGCIAQGIAGRMGSGEQFVAIIPKGVVFSTSYSGRLYGGPSSHYYMWDGERLLAATWDERAAADLF